ncbi:MAG: ferredoxin family protein [Candidatus Caldatribacterium sp.]|uniref:4Fe-4S dicluster domain-containing protein n=1 Tax=Candidatus Caldatribacterium sp. TaxID=2282143 RepID=UPI0029960AEB|nr:ferredoxin family protein [Candidatus Caldatribacterium sp.]MCX7730216.1 ferredoxin family protein [Candidatus Caldatribacterium sp.]MDW8080774.1 ferredoxin family protein [Candidatus Calescibacterium sp.]
MVRARVIVNREFCKGCTLCTYACPQGVLVISHDFNSRGYYPADVRDLEKCVGCGFCAQVCPDVAITVYRE